MLRSEEVRKIAPEMDPLRRGMGWSIEIDADTFDRMHRDAHYLLNIRPSGDWPAQYFYLSYSFVFVLINCNFVFEYKIF